jgi:hypothetical protein
MSTTEASIEELLEEGSTEIVRGHLRKIVEIYDLEWRVAHELVQNAIDAVQADTTSEDEGTVDITFDLKEDFIEVEDNGIGFKRDHDLLRPGGTGEEKRLKSRSPTKGYQGVGLKAVMYSTDYFEIESLTKGEQWTFISEGLREYIDEDDPIIPDYAEEVVDVGEGEETYTKVKARFPDNTLSSFIDGLNRFLTADSIRWTRLYKKRRDDNGRKPFECYLSHFLEWYFRTQSYVGCVNSLLGVEVKDPETDNYVKMSDVDINVRVNYGEDHNVGGKIGAWMDGILQNSLSFSIPYESWDYKEISRENQKLPDKYHITPEIVSVKPHEDVWDTIKGSLRDKFLDLKLTPDYDEDNFRDKYRDYISILERPYSSVDAEEYEYVMDKITGIYLAIGRTSYFELMGITNHGFRIISSNGTPTAHDLNVRSTSSTWYLETIHFVVNLDSKLNVGKRHLANTRLVGKVRDFFEACYPKLVSISKRLVKRDTSTSPGVSMPEVVPNGKIDRKGISFRRFPEDESTLVGLFSNAISKLYPEFSIYGLFRGATYDGKFSWDENEILSDADLSSLEFKTDVDELTNEFDLSVEEKEFTDVSLVVVWNRDSTRDGWVVKGISPDQRNQLENAGVPTDLVDFVLEDGFGNSRPLLCVADMLQKIPPREGQVDDIDDFVESLG